MYAAKHKVGTRKTSHVHQVGHNSCSRFLKTMTNNHLSFHNESSSEMVGRRNMLNAKCYVSCSAGWRLPQCCHSLTSPAGEARL